MTEATPPKPDFVDMPERQVAAMVGDFSMSTRNEIPGLWNRYFAAEAKPENAVNGAMYGISFSADGKGNFRYGVGAEVDPPPRALPDGFCFVTLSGGPYAVFRVFGPVSELPGKFDWIFQNWLPASGNTLRDGAVFERYPEDARNGPDGMACEIWVPLAT